MIVNSVKKMHARRNPGLVVSSTAFSQPFSPSMNSASFLSPRLASHRVLLEATSPPPSPSLPSLIPRHGKKPSSASHSRLVKRLLIACCGVTIIVWLGIRHLYSERRTWADRYTSDGSNEYEMVGDSFLPSDPSAVIVTDKKENPKWTVSIPESYEFPLKPAHYREICKQSMELSQHLTENGKSHTKRSMSYYSEDPYYMDVREAQEQGLLPKPKPHRNREMDDGLTPGEEDGMIVCKRSLTYAMETVDAGLGNTLMAMWMSYGLAMKEGRAWFYDDTRWPYGKYSTYFTPPPAAGCLPPPKSEIVPCPHNARHIVVSPALITHTFGHAFNYEFEDARKMEVQRQHKIFELARVGYEDLFTLREDDASYVKQRAQKLYEPVREAGGMSIGMHVRRGDRHPYEFQYSKDYLPLDRYVDTARDIFLSRLGNSTKSKKTNAKLATEIEARHTSSKMVLASDDPDVYPDPEMGAAQRVQDRIILASKTTLEKTAPKTNPYIDEISGWEGGFFKDVFWSLGQPRTNANDAASAGHEVTQEGSRQAMELRELVGRAYLMDLAVLAQADAVVCTVSSLGCRLMAVMMGWESAIEQGNWKNVDGMFEWRGIMW